MSRLLVLAETDGSRILPATLSALAFAQQYAVLTEAQFDLLLVGGPAIEGDAGNWMNYGAAEVLAVSDAALTHPTADQVGAICVAAMEDTGCNSLAATATTFGRDALPRAAALSGLPMLSDVLAIDGSKGELTFKRPMYAGNIIATVTVDDGSAVYSVRSTAFSKPALSETASARFSFSLPTVPAARAEWISLDAAQQSRPELTTARVVVSGGRPLKDAATFERVIGGLADKLGGAVGATRAAVDSGIVSNEFQVGQTGKVVAPDLYIAAGISGSVQHLAGMKDSKVIVAINTDPDAPIFHAADYGLVADLYQAVPELIGSLDSSSSGLSHTEGAATSAPTVPASSASKVATRTLFFHISTAMQVLFYALALVSMAICSYGFYRRARLWKQGRTAPPIADWCSRLKRLFNQAILQKRVRLRTYAGAMHSAIFFGLGALFVGTVIVGIEHYGALVFGEHWLYRGWFYLLCKVTLDVFGVCVVLGSLLALLRRYGGSRPDSLGSNWKDGAFLTLLLVATLTGFMLEGAGLASDQTRAAYAAFSPVGRLFAASVPGITAASYAVIWWIHISLVLGVIAALPYGRWLHLFVIPMAILKQPDRAMGALEQVSIAELEETGRIGYSSAADLDTWQLMSLDGCMECGRCTDACPANIAGKELNPKQIVLDLRSLMAMPTANADTAAGNSTDSISDAALWACTNCHACVRECPALIRHVDIIDGIRRYRVGEGRLTGSAATMLRQLGSRENPWGLSVSQRLEWAHGMEIPLADRDDGREVLFWVGCSGAFEPRGQQTARAVAQLLGMAGVNFSILGPRERCTGDPARRTGDEFLFHQLAQANIDTLNDIGAKTIVTQCPHCLNTLKNEYPQFGGAFEVVHHTQLLARLVSEKRLKIPAGFEGEVTYHDPCFLARVNEITHEPRAALEASLDTQLLEPTRRESKTLCCGAGGGRMWMEESPSERPGLVRARELIATGAKNVAVGCPFCKVMIGDSIKLAQPESEIRVMDVAEVMLAAAQSGAAETSKEQA